MICGLCIVTEFTGWYYLSDKVSDKCCPCLIIHDQSVSLSHLAWSLGCNSVSQHYQKLFKVMWFCSLKKRPFQEQTKGLLLFMYFVPRWQEESSTTWAVCVKWIVLMFTPWCVTCAMSSTSPHVYWTATTSFVPAAWEVGLLTIASAAPSVGKRGHFEVRHGQIRLWKYKSNMVF